MPMHVDYEELKLEAARWTKAARDARADGDESAELWEAAAKRARRDLILFEAGRLHGIFEPLVKRK